MTSTEHSLPVLYSFRRCPYAVRARMALVYSNTVVELREVKLSHKPQSMLDISAKGTVPVLQLTDGRVLDESIDIIHWSLSRHDPQDWALSKNQKLRDKAMELVWKNDHVFKSHLDRYKYPDRYPGCVAEHHRQLGLEFLLELEDALQDEPYLLTGHTCIADISIFPFIRQFAFVDMQWFEQTDLPGLRAWLYGFLDSALFQGVMDKYPPWDKSNSVILPDLET